MRKLVILLAAGFSLGAPAAATAAEQFAGLTSENAIVLFRSDSPGNLQGGVPVVGLQVNERLHAIAGLAGRIYGLGSSNRLYLIEPVTGVASPLSNTPFSPALQGTTFSMAIDLPTQQARVISDTGQNLRISIANGQVAGVDPPLQYVNGDPGINTTPALNGLAYSIPGTGSGAGSSLYAIDTARDVLVTSATLSATIRTIGPLDVDAVDAAPILITPTGAAYAALRPGTGQHPRLYTVDLSTGKATIAAADDALATIAYRLSSTAAADTPIIALADLGVAPDDETKPIATIDAQQFPEAATLRRSGYLMNVGCNEACTVTATLSVGRVRMTPAEGAVLSTAGKLGLRIRLTAAAKNLLKKDPTQGLGLRIRIVDAAGNTVNASRRGATQD